MSNQISFPVGVNTTAIHAGESPDPISKASAPNICMSTTFVADAEAAFSVEVMEEGTSWTYSRWGNPTVRQLEEKLSAVEHAETAVAFGSGMGALSALLFHTLKAGDHAIVSDVAYAAMSEMTNEMIPQLGIEITKVDTSDVAAVRKAMRRNTRLVHIETPCNPLMRLTDIKAVADIAHDGGAKLSVDSTFATPMATRPVELGADFVVHSLTKYICGHGDSLGGAILGTREDIVPLRKRTAIKLGGVLSPFNAWLIMRGIATLPIRMKAHEANALEVAKFLEGHDKITKVFYPGLPSHPQHELAKKQMRNFSGMMTFQTRDGKAAARIFSKKLEIIHYAVSLGHHRSLLFYLPSEDLLKTSFRLDTKKQRDSWNKFAGDGIFRFSVGLEDAEDIIRDIENSLADIR